VSYKKPLFILLCALAFVSPATAQVSKGTIDTEIAASSAAGQPGGTILNNIVASYVDWLTCTGSGGTIYWSAGTPTCLAIGTQGQYLNVNAGFPQWASFGSGVFAALGNPLNSSGGLVGFSGNIGAASGTSLALGGATLGGNALAVTGSSLFQGMTGNALALGGCTIGSNALCVTGALAFPNNSLTLAEFPTIAANTVLGSIAGGTPTALSQAQLTSLVNIATTSLSGAFPANIQVFAAAVCNGSTDDTAAIAAGIAATPSGGTLVIPAGNCLVSGSGSAIFTVTAPINIVGQGMSLTGAGTTILVSSAVPTSRDIFHIVPTINTSPRGFTFSKFSVKSQTGSPTGAQILHFDTTAGTTTNIADIVIFQVYMDPNASAGGFSIFLDNGTGTNTNGGESFVTIQNSFLGGGLSCAFCGDSIRLLNNQIFTLNAGFTINQIAGAGGFWAAGNNIVAAGGNIISAAVAPVIGPGNEFEQQVTNTEANNSILDLTGSVINISTPKIFGNSIVGLTGTGNPNIIRLAAVTGGSVENNFIGGPTTGTQLLITSAAASVTVGIENTFAGSGTAISNSGTGTIFPPKTINGSTCSTSFACNISNIISTGTPPVGTTGSCTASGFVGGSTAGKFTAALCAAGTYILSGLPTAPNGYTCNAQDQTTVADLLQQTANSTTSVTFKATTAASDVVVFQCTGW
jgi:hypothetical protein